MADPSYPERADAAYDGPPEPGEEDVLLAMIPGTIVDGKYRVDGIIGRGGMGFVASATHIHLDERVALKFLHVDEDQVGVDFRARFSLEARVCARLRNEHIARVHDVGIWQSRTPFMVMEYLEGVDLRRLLRGGAKLPCAQAVDTIVQICEGLAEAHAQGIVHRDLKPPNIFLTKRRDGSELVKVLDFGISKWTSDDEQVGELTKTGVMLGSPKYMSPEQLNGTPVDARADIWSLGAVLYQMLTGRPPYDFASVPQTFMAIATGETPPAPSTLDPTIPPALDAVILRCLTREKSARVQNVAELAGALLDAVDSPFANPVRAQLGAVLGPNSPLSSRGGPMSTTTGSHAAFSLGSTRASPLPETLAPEAMTSRPSGPGRVRPRLLVPVAVVVMVGSALVALAEARHASDAGSSGGSGTDPSAKVFRAKHLARDARTTLVKPSIVALTPQRWASSPARGSSARHAAPTASAQEAPAAPGPTVTLVPAPAMTSASNPLEDRQ